MRYLILYTLVAILYFFWSKDWMDEEDIKMTEEGDFNVFKDLFVVIFCLLWPIWVITDIYGLLKRRD